MHEICTEEELQLYFENTNNEGHIVNRVLHRIAKTLHDNPTFSFGSYDEEDIYQFCWLWCIETLMLTKCKKTGVMKRRYNCKSSLYGYLDKVCKRRISKLKRDKQWRSDISDQKACRACKDRETCPRKIEYGNFDQIPRCEVMAKAIQRNSSKYALSVQADHDITEPVYHKDEYICVELEDITEFFGEQIPQKYKIVFQNILQGNTAGIPKNTLIAARRWCWRILRKMDIEQAAYYEKIYYNSYQKELMRKLRKNPSSVKRAPGRPAKKNKPKYKKK